MEEDGMSAVETMTETQRQSSGKSYIPILAGWGTPLVS